MSSELWPVVPDNGGPYADQRDNYADDAETILDLYDADETPVLSPCDVRQLRCPDLADHIECRWFEQLDDSNLCELTADMKAVLAAVEQLVNERALCVWDARSERIAVHWSDNENGWVVT